MPRSRSYPAPLFVVEVGERNPLVDLAGRSPHGFWLDSSLPDPRLGRFSFWGTRPRCVLSARGRRLALARPGEGTVRWEGDPFAALKALLARGRRERGASGLPFQGGAVGYFGYGLRTLLEDVPARARDDVRFPSLYFAFYDSFWALDRMRGKTFRVGGGAGAEGDGASGGVRQRAVEQVARSEGRRHATGAASTFSREQYCAAVECAQAYIAAGDIYQVNLSQRFSVEGAAEPARLFDRMRRLNPAPFSALLRMGGRSVVSASPERFLRVEGRHVETRPIKGTRRRGGNAREDARLGRELVASEKDNAELAMIVDLERNDLGRVCELGSVRVTEPRVLEAYPTVFHLVATVEGDLRGGVDVVDLVKATFPGGSITGVPKIRAMEIIDELEPTARNVYTGALGYLGFDGSADLSIGIRLLEVGKRGLTFQVGGGIVADSDPQAEYEETLAKAAGLFRVLEIDGFDK
ncbi:MAG: aminodeoxychorismate synthase component I [Planctomycetes bacterium]|nr:aminodeoxychorismate synthase component I [Planctomycetota bacterium]